MKYRREIDGLRALAILPVVFHHAGFSFFSGGYVGVDVFFVISGYLITTIILNESEQGAFSFINFYERRIRRIFPALFVMLGVCLLITWKWVSPYEYKEFSIALITVSLFIYNLIYIYLHSYFTPEAAELPLLHAWSLSVEEQYYLIIPAVIIIFSLFKKAWLVGFLCVVAIISLCIAEYGSRHHPAANFYLTPSRAWELLIGTLLAIAIFKKQLHSRFNHYISDSIAMIGLLAIIYSIIFFDYNTRFPSLYTLVPVLGAAAVIGFARQDSIVAKILSLKIFVGIGLISYSVYLWHQPLFAYSRFFSVDEPSQTLLFVLCFVSLFLGFISWKYIERPFRNRKNFTTNKIYLFAFLAITLFVTLGILGYLKDGFPNRNTYFASLEEYERPLECLDIDKIKQNTGWNCLLNNSTKKEPSFVVVGDSHAQSMMIGFELAAQHADLQGLITGFPGCIPLKNSYRLRAVGDEVGGCDYLNTKVFNFIKNNNENTSNEKINDIFFVARWAAYTDGDYTGSEEAIAFIGKEKDSPKSKEISRKTFETSLEKTLHDYNSIGVNVYVVTQIPHQTFNPEKVYTQMNFIGGSYEKFQSYSIPYEKHIELQSYVNSKFEFYSKNKLLNVINFDDIFCDDNLCSFGTNEVSYYVNQDHLSVEGAKKVVDNLVIILTENIKAM